MRNICRHKLKSFVSLGMKPCGMAMTYLYRFFCHAKMGMPVTFPEYNKPLIHDASDYTYNHPLF